MVANDDLQQAVAGADPPIVALASSRPRVFGNGFRSCHGFPHLGLTTGEIVRMPDKDVRRANHH